MAATSPYQANDYQAVSNYRPYELPINDIFKAISAQNQFWDAGAQRVKSVYEDALNLKLSLEPNRMIRDEFMRDAEKKINRLSTMDLSDPSVQREGFSIFKPLFKDEGILYDDLTTRHYEKVRQDALSYRDKDHGKEYSDTNMAYAMDGYNEFVTSKDRMAGKKFYQNRKEYNPYYDATDELNTILNRCKPSTAMGEGIDGFYIRSSTDESLSARKINTCLDAGLSDRAKRQLQINGAVTYRRNPLALRDKYVPHLNGTIGQLTEDNSAIKGILANKANLASLKKEDLAKIGISDPSQLTPEFIQGLETMVQTNQNRINNLNTSIGKLMTGDLSDISGDNFETVAGAMYSSDYMRNVAEGFSYDLRKNTLRADPIQSMFFTQNQINARQEDDQQFDLQMQQMRLDNDLVLKQMEMAMKAGNVKGVKSRLGAGFEDMFRVQNDTSSPFASIDKSDSYEKVTQKITETANKRKGLNSDFIRDMKMYGLDTDVKDISDNRFQQFFSTFKTTSKSDPEKLKMVNEYETQLSELMALEKLYSNTQDNVNTKLAPQREALQAKINSIPSVNLGGVDINAQDVLDARKGISNKGLTVKYRDFYVQSEGSALSGQKGTNVPIEEFYMNGKKISEAGEWIDPVTRAVHKAVTGKSFKPFDDLVNKTDSEIKQGNTQYIKSRDEMMQRETVLQKEGYIFPGLNDKDSGLKQTIAANIGLPVDYIDDLIIGQTDLNGRLIVSLNTDRVNAKKDYNAEEVLKSLRSYGGRDNKSPEGKPNQVVLEGFNDLDLINENNLEGIITPYVRTLETKALAQGQASTGYMPSNINAKDYKLDVARRYDGTYAYRIMEKDKPSPIFSSSDRQQALAQFQTLLRDRLPDIQVPRTPAPATR